MQIAGIHEKKVRKPQLIQFEIVEFFFREVTKYRALVTKKTLFTVLDPLNITIALKVIYMH